MSAVCDECGIVWLRHRTRSLHCGRTSGWGGEMPRERSVAERWVGLIGRRQRRGGIRCRAAETRWCKSSPLQC